jgi:hypothetical protein
MAQFLRSKNNNPSQGYSSGADQRDVTRFAPTFQRPGSIFGPGYPLVPPSRQLTRGWDYPVAWNTNYRPRSYEPIGFGELRSLAERHTLTSLAIETRKDQIESLDWGFRPVGTDDMGRQARASKEQQGRIDGLMQLFRYPDGTHDFGTWLRQIVDDVLVIDAAAIEVRYSRGGKVIGFDQLDGGTIKPLLDETGRRPIAPNPAYQQIIHGRPWVLLEDGGRADIDEGQVYTEFNDGQLVYLPRNPRIWKGYGRSPVEQIFTYMQIGLRQADRQLAYFAEGNVPPGMINAPEGANRDQVKEWQDWFDSKYSGNDTARSQIVWGPSGASYQPFTEPPFRADFDVWLGRIVCYAFSLPPSWLTPQVNRATAQSAQETSQEEGQLPLKNWVVRLMNLLIQQRMAQSDLEFAWEESIEVDPVKQATILTGFVGAGVYNRNEAREILGKDAIEGGDIATVDTATGPVAVSDIAAISSNTANPPEPAPAAADGGPGGAAGKDAGKPNGKPAPTGSESKPSQKSTELAPNPALSGNGEVAKAGADPFGVPASRSYLATDRDAIEKALAVFFRREPELIARDVLRATPTTKTTKTTKASDHTDPDQHGVAPLEDPHRAREISATVAAALVGINWSRWSDLVGEISPHLEDASTQTVSDTLDAVHAQLTDPQVEAVKAEARKWAQDRAAEFVGRSRIGGRTIQDAGAEHDITDSTAQMIAEDVRQAIADKSTVEELTAVLSKAYAFSPQRARVIADYETKSALHNSTMTAFKASNRVKGSYWQTMNDLRVEATCLLNEAASPVRLGHLFPSGHSAPLAHNGCRCWLEPWMESE